MPTSSIDPRRPGDHRGSPDEGDFGTDPGRAYPYESLYRSASGEPGGHLRPSPRHWEPSLRPPDGEHQGFGWLYRIDPDPADLGPRPPTPSEPDLAVTQIEPAGFASAKTAPTPVRSGAQSRSSRKRASGGRAVLQILVIVALSAMTAVIVWAVVTDRPPRLFGNAAPVVSGSPATPGATTFAPVQPAPTTATKHQLAAQVTLTFPSGTETAARPA